MKTHESRMEVHEITLQEFKERLSIKGDVEEIQPLADEEGKCSGVCYVEWIVEK